ncbi:MAG TPA: hypothetical protein DCS07_07810, partial [Bdellovibrionales bacterium]|nr:hypothetical protein [Bdellovibrionales bacterium]
MKTTNTILFTILGLMIASGALAEDSGAKRTRYINGSIKVERTWFERTGDVNEVRRDTPCHMEIKVPVLDLRDSIPPSDFNGPGIFNCKTQLKNGAEANVQTFANIIYSPEQRKSFSASYSVNNGSDAGSSAYFSTKDMNLS